METISETTTIIVMPRKDAELLIQVLELIPVARGTPSALVVETTIFRLRESMKGPVNANTEANQKTL